MIKNEGVKATLEAKEWEGELDDADLTAVSGGGVVQNAQDLAGSAQQFVENTSSDSQTLAGALTAAADQFAVAAKEAVKGFV
ncbi:hypothetical protein SD81_002195 [Tolypothrix campylonemoides VB511288]|nr:hypothetical protein SD81_002195 [Tolypothrix campylonemoides VB511288]